MTPEEIQKIATERGDTVVNPTGDANAPMSAQQAYAQRNGYDPNASTVSATPAAPKTLGDNYIDNVNPMASDFNDLEVDAGLPNDLGVDAGLPKGNLGNAVDKFQKGDVLGGTEDATLGVASDAVKAIFAPIAAPLETLMSHVASGNAALAAKGHPDIANPSSTPASQAAQKQIADWVTQLAQTHPQIAKTLGDAFNVGTAALGSGALDTSVSDAAGAIKNGVSDTVQGAKDLVTRTPADATAGVTDLIKQDPETMTQGMKNEAVTDGRQTIKSTKLGGTEVDYTPTKQIDRAATILSDPEQMANPIKPGDAPNVVVAKVKSAISTKGAQAEKYLADNPVYVSNKESADMISAMKTKAEETSTPTEMKAYNDQLDLFQKQLQSQSAKTGTLNTSDYYLALKKYETEIASKFKGGKAALADPEGIGSAKIQAASDIRSTVRDMIGDKHPDFASKMQDISSLYEARDNAIFNAGKTRSATFFDKHPRVKAAAKVGLGLTGAEGLHKVVTGGF